MQVELTRRTGRGRSGEAEGQRAGTEQGEWEDATARGEVGESHNRMPRPDGDPRGTIG